MSSYDYDDGFSAGCVVTKGKIVDWLRKEDFGKDAPINSVAHGMYLGIMEAANDIEDGAPWNE